MCSLELRRLTSYDGDDADDDQDDDSMFYVQIVLYPVTYISTYIIFLSLL